MSKQHSDYSKPFTDLTDYLPEVYRSDINQTVFDVALNRHLTKDDTVRVAGYVGEKKTGTAADRQLKEQTPHRQAYQLAPTMVSKIGTVDSALSYKAFQSQLKLMGVNFDRLPLWANTTQFNWVPPVNMDMLVNYQDYFWNASSPTDAPQYITVENRCNRALSKVRSYDELMVQRGKTFSVTGIDFANNTFTINDLNNDLFATGFVFFTTSPAANLTDRFWTVASSEYVIGDNSTVITLVEPLATVSDTQPTATTVGQWWFNTSNNRLYAWSGSAWVVTATQQTITISLAELGALYQIDSNCACSDSDGWDTAPWDDNQRFSAETSLWSTPVLAAISFPTSGEWNIVNGFPDAGNTLQYKIWFDTTANQLKEYNFTTSTWNIVASNFSAIAALSVGNSRWDTTVGCEAQELNEWAEQNHWVHRAEMQSHPSAQRAQLPILEYTSTAELNVWSKRTLQWKYRPAADVAFKSTASAPSRLELEPVKGFVVQNVSGDWYLYLHHVQTSVNQNIDYTDIFTPGMKFRIMNDDVLSQIYTVASSQFVEILSSHALATTIGSGQMVTVVRLEGNVYTGPASAGGPGDADNTRIVPILTGSGDTWLGYHVHWMLSEVDTAIAPTATPTLNLYAQRDKIAQRVVTATPGNLPHYESIVFGATFQEMTVLSTTLTAITFHTTFQPGNSRDFYAVPGSDDLRVYVNGVRQYGNYVEDVSSFTPDYTVVGTTAYTTIDINYVSGITFQHELNALDVVRIEFGPAAFADMGSYGIPVRTVEDEADFTAAVNDGAQPAYVSLSTQVKREQSKTVANQYPLFNIYDVVTSQVVKAGPFFAYKEDASADVNPYINRRIVSSATNREFEFEQFLLDRDDNILYGYKHVSAAEQYWYNPNDNTVKFWDGASWTSKILVQLASGASAVRVAIVSPIDPLTAYTPEGSLWYKTTTKTLAQRVGSAWVNVPNIVVNGSDPMLRTVWRHGDASYVPRYVNKDHEPVTVGSSLGDWELVDQWKYNPEHRNKQSIKYSQLITHFNSILAAQPRIPGLVGGGMYTLAQDDYNYGVGGTIKEHNDSFDTLISAVNVTNTTPTNVIEFAAQQYAVALTNIRQIFSTNGAALIGAYTPTALSNLSKYVTDSIINSYQANDFTAQVFGDSSAYDATTEVGVRNWIATAPMFGLAAAYRPHLTIDGHSVSVLHHDGHRSDIAFTPGEQDRLAKAIVRTVDPRGGTLGVIKTTAPASTRATFITEFGQQLRTGAFWYQLGSGQRKLFKLSAYDVSGLAPSIYDASGNEIADGLKYFNTGTNSVYTKQGTAWVVSATGGNIASLWEEVVFAKVLGQVYLELETRLYEATPARVDLAFDFTSLTSETDVYRALNEDRFMQYVAEQGISAPLLNVEYAPTNALSWNYAASPITYPPAIGVAPTPSASWQELYTRSYNTPYPHLEPWKLQGFHDKPTWWDAEYLDTTGARKWIYNHSTTTGMWENIRVGKIPAGRTNPDGSVSSGVSGAMRQYRYFSVNITNAVITGGYQPDALLPPYYDIGATAPTTTVRSVYRTYSSEIIAPDADYTFGSVGPVEWNWKSSVQAVYDPAIIAFKMQPARFMHSAFGPQYTIVDGLQVETTFHQVYSHVDALFHGDIYNTNEAYTVRGLNQWYVNLNRYNTFDTNSEFRELWVGWEPKLTYQFAGIVDTSTMDISNKYVDIIDQDYDILLVNNGVIRDLWTDSFNVGLINIPPAIIQYNNESQWKMEIKSTSSIARSISYYGVKSYAFVPKTSPDGFAICQYAMVSINPTARRVTLTGDLTSVLKVGSSFAIVGSTANNGNYTIASTVFDSNLDQTRVTTVQAIPSATTTGMLEASDFTASWATGDTVVLSTTKFLPAPLLPNTPYYVIRTGVRSFKLAETAQHAAEGITIDFTSDGVGQHTISQLDSSFNVYGGLGNSGELWFHYKVDKTDIRTFTPPRIVSGMQTFINMMDGYSAFQRDQGLLLGTADSNDFDELTGRLSDWALETERFIDWAYGLRHARVRVGDSYPVRIDSYTATISQSASTISVSSQTWSTGLAVRLLGSVPAPLVSGETYYLIDTPTAGTFKLGTSSTPLVPVTFTSAGSGTITATSDRIEFTQQEPVWRSGTEISMRATGSLPDPIIAGSSYYVVVTGAPGFIRLSTSLLATDITNYVEFNTSGVGILTLSLHDAQRVFPSLELNPTRNNVWIDTPLGVLADVVSGPYTDIRIQQTIYDQYNRPMGPDRLTVYRQDKRSHIAVVPNIKNDVDLAHVDDPYNYIHIGGGHFFTEGYEHFLVLKDETVDGSLVYNAFLGLYITQFELDFFKKEEYTLRPTLGGFYLLNNQFNRNMEGSIDDMRNYYDTFALSETSKVARRSRKLIGYNGSMPFLDWVNATEKTKFLFYKGMIQSKGSINSVNAYINSRRFVDAKIDEFWAYKIADFGDARPRFYPRVKLLATDAVYGDVRLKFLSRDEDPLDVQFDSATNNGFHLIDINNDARWDAHPQQLVTIKSPLFLDGEVSSVVTVYIGTTMPADSQNLATYFYNTSTSRMYAFNADAGTWTTEVTAFRIATQNVGSISTVYFNHGQIGDDVRVFHRTALTNYTTTELVADTDYSRDNATGVSMPATSFVGVIDVYVINPSATRINPAKLIDTLSTTVVTDIPVWHPAIGIHSHIAAHNIDLQANVDPARYGVSLNSDSSIAWHRDNSWNNAEVGTSWLDTAALGYVPYYDSTVYPAMNDRLSRWGNQAPWSSARVCEWVESTVAPDQWETAKLQNSALSGNVRMSSFYRTRSATAATATVMTSRLATSTAVFAALDQVLITADVLPVGITSSTKYVVTNVVGSNFQLQDPISEEVVEFTTAGTNVLIVPTFASTDWKKLPLAVERVTGPFVAANVRKIAGISTSFAWTGGYTLPTATVAWPATGSNNWTAGDTVDVYINGIIRDSAVTVQRDNTTGLYFAVVAGPVVIKKSDLVDIVRAEHIPTEEEASFNPDVLDDGTLMIQWKRDFEYTIRTLTTGTSTSNQQSTTYYYFWVEGSTSRRQGNSGISVKEAADQLSVIPTAHMVLQTPKDDTVPNYPDAFGITSDTQYSTPVLYRDAIIRKVSNYLTDDNRYVVQFTRDLALRDDIKANGRQMNLKNKHQEWLMFRREQDGTIDRNLWDRLTESMCGYKLTNPAIPVPAPARELYDARNGTDTRFGLGEDQAFADKNMATATILAYLRDPSRDFVSTDINVFFARYNFDTPENVVIAMNAIYTSFAATYVNSMWFETLQDAMSTKAQFAELMKTSWVALHGIRVLEVGGLFD